MDERGEMNKNIHQNIHNLWERIEDEKAASPKL
jgi:hypothetical protein